MTKHEYNTHRTMYNCTMICIVYKSCVILTSTSTSPCVLSFPSDLPDFVQLLLCKGFIFRLKGIFFAAEFKLLDRVSIKFQLLLIFVVTKQISELYFKQA